jgi:hypothetical protein
VEYDVRDDLPDETKYSTGTASKEIIENLLKGFLCSGVDARAMQFQE